LRAKSGHGFVRIKTDLSDTRSSIIVSAGIPLNAIDAKGSIARGTWGCKIKGLGRGQHVKNLLILVAVIALCELGTSQSTEAVLYSFGAYPADGAFPNGGLLLDSAGNIYGTTPGGGQYCEDNGGCGTVYELSPTIEGGWTETVLYNFCPAQNPPDCPDGYGPLAGLIIDRTGNLCGTTYGGGTNKVGIVFRLNRPANGDVSWTETVLWNFSGAKDNGYFPGYGKLNMDSLGNLYGTTTQGGAKNLGIVFQLSPQGDASYSFLLLHSFSGPDGALPQYGVAIDKAGNLYGTTRLGGAGRSICKGGAGGCGVIYELSPSDGAWKGTILYKFNGIAGAYPTSPISIDKSGNLYGTFEIGGGGSCYFGTCGGVFKLVPQSGGSKGYAFYFNGGQNGGAPETGVLLGAHDTAYGTTYSGNNVYALTGDHETVLYTFCSLPNCDDGSFPSYGTLVGREGLLYGNTIEGGSYGEGVVYTVPQ
jgi:uncharacterized repeat protein (TIGR03803 family)